MVSVPTAKIPALFVMPELPFTAKTEFGEALPPPPSFEVAVTAPCVFIASLVAKVPSATVLKFNMPFSVLFDASEISESI